MKKACVWLLGMVAALVLTAPAVYAQQAAGGEGWRPEVKPEVKPWDHRKPDARSQQDDDSLDKMIGELDLDDEAKAKVDEQLRTYKKATDAWDKDNREKLTQLRKDFEALNKQRADLATENRQKVLALLNDEQKTKLTGLELSRPVLDRYQRAKLTDEQVAKVKEMCCSVAPGLEGKEGEDKDEAMQKLHKEVQEKVLNDDQRRLMQSREGREDRLRPDEGRRLDLRPDEGRGRELRPKTAPKKPDLPKMDEPEDNKPRGNRNWE